MWAEVFCKKWLWLGKFGKDKKVRAVERRFERKWKCENEDGKRCWREWDPCYMWCFTPSWLDFGRLWKRSKSHNCCMEFSKIYTIPSYHCFCIIIFFKTSLFLTLLFDYYLLHFWTLYFEIITFCDPVGLLYSFLLPYPFFFFSKHF